MCVPIEEASVGEYDVVWANAILHHLLHDLDNVVP